MWCGGGSNFELHCIEKKLWSLARRASNQNDTVILTLIHGLIITFKTGAHSFHEKFNVFWPMQRRKQKCNCSIESLQPKIIMIDAVIYKSASLI